MHQNSDGDSVSASACAVLWGVAAEAASAMLLHVLLLLAMRQVHGSWQRSTTTTGGLPDTPCSCVSFCAAVFRSATMCPTKDGPVSLLV